jgi:hypothetical protein
VFHLPDYKRDANQNYTKNELSTQLEWPHSRAKTNKCWEDAAKQEPLYTDGGHEN